MAISIILMEWLKGKIEFLGIHRICFENKAAMKIGCKGTKIKSKGEGRIYHLIYAYEIMPPIWIVNDSGSIDDDFGSQNLSDANVMMKSDSD